MDISDHRTKANRTKSIRSRSGHTRITTASQQHSVARVEAKIEGNTNTVKQRRKESTQESTHLKTTTAHHRYAAACAESQRGSHQWSPVLGRASRYCCRRVLAEVPKGSDKNAELKLRLQLWETGDVSELTGRMCGQQHSGPLH